MRSLLLPLVLLAIAASACATKSAATVSSDGASAVNTPPPRPEPVKPLPAPKQVAELPPLDFSPSEARVTISGHTCELGTTEYNLALGQRRAASARDYLVRLGVESDRISIVSYGEERPAETGSGESVWSKNRRSEFTISVAHARAGGQ